MKHTSVAIAAPEFINITKISPLISKCTIKVLWVGNEINRNKGIFTREVAEEIAQTLPGSPIVGHYINSKKDFNEHDKFLTIEDGKLKMASQTVPYGFVDLKAKVWFQKFMDDGVNEREYLCCEGYLWTGQFPEANRVIEKGNAQSMELDPKSVKGNWAKTKNGDVEIFIFNEAVISKLCILGEDVEPCFEGGSITKYEFSLDDEFKNTMFSMIKDLQEAIEGGLLMEDNIIEVTTIVDSTEIVRETQDTAVVHIMESQEAIVVVDKTEETTTEFSEKTLDETEKEEEGKNDVSTEDEEKVKYSLDEVIEYTALKAEYDELQTNFSLVQSELDTLKTEFARLQAFETDYVCKQKDELITSFYMLSDEDKKDVIDNKLNYSLEDIEAKLSVICVRNKVNFSLDDTKKEEVDSKILTYSLDSQNDSSLPGWVQAVKKKQEKK